MAGAPADSGLQWIEDWGATDDGRLVGAVHSGQGGLKTIVTSPVVRVGHVGEIAVAFTESGTAYALKDPAPSFGAGRAQKFFQRLATEDRASQAVNELDQEETRILQLPPRGPRDA